MTEQQPQEPYGDPQYESYREVMPTEPSSVVPSSVMPSSPIPAASMSQPTESVPTTSMPTESIPTTARRARQEHHGSARHHNRTPHTDSLQPRGLPHPGRMRPALSRLLKPVRHRAHTKRPAHGPGRSTAHHRRHHPRSPRAKQIVRPIPHTSRTRCRHTSSTARCSPRGKQASGRAASRR